MRSEMAAIDERENQDKSIEKSQNEIFASELADDYVKYVRIDVAKQKTLLEDNIEEILIRLDKYCGLVDMVRSDGSLCFGHTLPEIYAKTCELEKLFFKIDKLQMFINVVQKNIAAMEEKMNAAELQLGSNSVKKLISSIQKPLFAKRNHSDLDQRIVRYEEPNIFQASDYFSPSETESKLSDFESSSVKTIIETEENLSKDKS